MVRMLRDPKVSWVEGLFDERSSADVVGLDIECSAALWSPRLSDCERVAWDFERRARNITLDPNNGPCIKKFGKSVFFSSSKTHRAK